MAKVSMSRIIPDFTDVHCHILPGLDDGSQSMDETLEMLRIAEAEGIRRMIVTPHYKEGRRSADPDTILRRMEEVQRLLEDEGIDIRLYPGNEIYYTSELEEKLESGRILSMNYTEYLLVEFSPFEDYIYIRNAMDNIRSLGYTPILAHVERYECMLKDRKHVEEMRALGCMIQVNASSVTGENGSKVKRFVHKLLKLALVDFVGTDAHNTGRRKPALWKCAELLYKKYGAEYADALLTGNAEEILLS
ncbi:MAG: protein-tyrosine-phosphatase [Lachnospiraceae bacterium]|nr:protein-tyrosine-phosphatase [Lachnospiraceae bacterium]